MVQMLLLAGPGVLISTVLIGAAVKLVFPYDWNWKTSLLLGAVLSATDPVAVVALLKDMGASKKLSTIVEGESMMNDGAAIVVYQLFYRMVLGKSSGSVSVLEYLAEGSLGSVMIGLVFGMASLFWLRFIYNDTLTDFSLALTVSYIAYYTECTIVVSKLLAPDLFKKFSVQEVRSIVDERSVMNTFSSQEVIETSHYSVNFLLSGCLRDQSTERLIECPAVLPCAVLSDSITYTSANVTGESSGSYSYSTYKVTKPARIVRIDISAA